MVRRWCYSTGHSCHSVCFHLCHLDFSTKPCENTSLHHQDELVGTSWQCRQIVVRDGTENESEFQTDVFEVKVKPSDGRLKIFLWLTLLKHRRRLWVYSCCWRLSWHNDVVCINSLWQAYEFYFWELLPYVKVEWIREWTDYICCIHLVVSPVGGTSNPGVWRLLWNGDVQQIFSLNCVGWYFWSALRISVLLMSTVLLSEFLQFHRMAVNCLVQNKWKKTEVKNSSFQVGSHAQLRANQAR